MRWLSDAVVARLHAEAQLPDLSGTRYRAQRFLARGGMGAVWLAKDIVLRRSVALKILAPENSSADLAARLLREAEVLARLEHPGIVPVHDAGTLADGRTFYCMKYVEGQTLDQYVAQLPLRERLQLLQRIAEPLAFAHSRGVIHRDLKPGNIMIGAFGEVLRTGVWRSSLAYQGTIIANRSMEKARKLFRRSRLATAVCWARQVTWRRNRPGARCNRSTIAPTYLPSALC